MHGMCALMISHRCKAYPEMDPIELLNNGFSTFISLMEKA